MNLNDLFNEEKVRLDPKCWTGKKIGNPKTKMKGGVRVNNCVPAESVEETRRGQVPMTLKPGETDNLEPEDFAGFKKLPAYQQGFQAQQRAGKQLIQKSPYTFQSDQDWAYRQGATDAQRAGMFANFGGTKPLTTTEDSLEEVDRRGFLKGAGAAAVAGAAGYKLGQNNTSDNANPYTTDKLSSEDLNAIDTFLTWYTVVKRHGKPSAINPSNINFDVDLELGTVKDLIKVYGKDFIFSRLKKIQDRVFNMSDQELRKEFNRVWTGPADTSKQAYIHNKLLPDYRLNKENVEQGMAEGEQKKGADYRDPKEVDYDGEYDAMVARVKRLAGLGPLKTVYDPNKRVYRNMPTAVQPKK
jgi:hypothetical protein